MDQYFGYPQDYILVPENSTAAGRQSLLGLSFDTQPMERGLHLQQPHPHAPDLHANIRPFFADDPQNLFAQYRYPTPTFVYPPPGIVHPPPHQATPFHLAPREIAPPRGLTTAQSSESMSSFASNGSMSTASLQPLSTATSAGEQASVAWPAVPTEPPSPASVTISTNSSATSPPAQMTNWAPAFVSQREADAVPLGSPSAAAFEVTATGTVRSRRAAASKARSTIASLATAMRSPPPTAETRESQRIAAPSAPAIPCVPAMPSRPASTAPSAFSGIPSPPLTALSASDQFPISTNSTLNLSIPIYSAKGPTTMLPLRNHRGYLLPAPADAQLEVNDLLILHPPALSPGKAQQPMSQYNPAPSVEGYRSSFEMYTCRVCSKTYDGKNARSVARRHLQDKHGVPLSVQKRRTRWDIESEQLRAPEVVREKTLKIKREWATKARVLNRLSKVHSIFLAQYGPNGIHLPDGTHLVAESMKTNSSSTRIRAKVPALTRLRWGQIPRKMRDEIAKLNQLDLSEIEDEMEAEPVSTIDEAGRLQDDNQPGPSNLAQVPPASAAGPPVAPVYRLGRPKRVKTQSVSTTTSALSVSTQSVSSSDYPAQGDTPAVDDVAPVDEAPAPNDTPDTDAIDDLTDMSELGSSYPENWGAATHIDDHTLQMAWEQHYNSVDEAFPSDFDTDGDLAAALANIVGADYDATGTTAEGDDISFDGIESPDPLFTLEESPAQVWQPSGDTFWSATAVYGRLLGSHGQDARGSGHQNSANPTQLDQTTSTVRRDTAHGGPVDTVFAAESLLDLHTTPARPDDRAVHSVTPRQRLSDASKASKSASSAIRSLLDAPQITPRPHPARAKSFVQPFAKSRPDALSRTISFNTPALDDPFAFTSSTPGASDSRDRDPGGKRRRPIASPSPLTSKRKKDVGRVVSASNVLGASSRLNVLSSQAHSAGSHHALAAMTGFGAYDSGPLPGAFVTPIKRAPRVEQATRGSATKGASNWQFSSPGVPGFAASLGLLPDAGVVGWTPGMNGIVNSDTPAKRRPGK